MTAIVATELAGVPVGIAALAAAAVALAPAPSKAAVPEAVGYQGYLTDVGGIAVTAALPITFRIYADEVGGNSIWEETHPSVDVLSGAFTVILGSTQPLTTALFSGSADLWLGIQVDVDGEMAPRQLIASVPFALHAGVAGSALTADSALHADDADAVGGDTLAAIEATMDTKLVAHASLTGAHHAPKSAAEVRADINADATHGSAATHNYFSPTEAVTAMGTKADTNPLHHDRYAPAVFQAADGVAITTTSNTFVATGLAVTPGAGDYLVWFSASMEGSAADTTQLAVLAVNGSVIGHTQRRLRTEASIPNSEFPVALQARVVGVNVGEVVEIYWRTTGGTATMYQRTLTLLRY